MARSKPGWKPNRRRRRGRRSRRSASRTAGRRNKGPSWFEKLKSWLTSRTGAGFGISSLVHVVVLILLSLFVVKGLSHDEEQIVTSISEADSDEDVAFDEFQDLQIDLPTQANSSTLKETLNLQPSSMEPVLAAMGSQGTGDTGNAVGFRMPAGGKAVTKGSFTAWTVPEDPKPRQDYLIVIQVKLPAKITKYRKEDLTGFLVGDDGYTTPIGSYRGSKYAQKYYGQFDMTAKQFIIKIPGAAEKVKDEIRIESKILKEKQQLEIVF